MRIYWLISLALLALMGCNSAETSTPVFHAASNPPALSDWNVVTIDAGHLALSERVTIYDLNTPLFSDYAHKLRTVYLPEGQTAVYDESESFAFPVGTIITKTFYYPSEKTGSQTISLNQTPVAIDPVNGLDLSKITLVETRVLARREEGWVALPYVWNAEQTQATLQRTGAIKRFEVASADASKAFSYVVPNVNQCAGCHAENASTKELRTIGPKARHLNKNGQLEAWAEAGLLTGLPRHPPQNAVWTDASAPLKDRARAYLDINCSHCHNKNGPADTSGLYMRPDDPDGVNLGTCKMPIAAGKGTGNRRYDIVPGDAGASIMTYRMASTDPSSMMPELGRALAHDEGVRLIADWIAAMDGACEG